MFLDAEEGLLIEGIELAILFVRSSLIILQSPCATGALQA